MDMKKSVFAVALASALVAVVPAAFPADAPLQGGPVCEAAVSHRNEGLELRIPEIYDNLLYTKVFEEDDRGRLFSVAEAKSVAHAWIQNERQDGPGWLFTIGRVSESRMRRMLCQVMTGAEVFAKDDKGNHYIFYHPTDVRLVREDYAAMGRDQETWSELNRWAEQDVRYSFIEANKCLIGETYDNSNVGMHLARAAYGSKADYTISTTRFGPLAPGEVDAAPYVEKLIRGASYEMIDGSQTPDGEYVVLNFPGEKIRFDFFKLQGYENYVREVHEDGYELLYKATFNDDSIKAGAVMQKWYNELVAAR